MTKRPASPVRVLAHRRTARLEQQLMGLPDFFPRLLAALRHGAADPVSSFGSVFRGTYEPRGSRIIGGVGDVDGRNLYPPIQVRALRDGKVVAATEQLEKHRNGWRFRLELDAPVTSDDILGDHISVFAIDRRGNRSQLF